MIDVISVSKKYGKRYAVRDISFHVQEGEIVGLLGPNGAGKSTTMKIITGYLSASEGKVVIDGHDVEEEPEEARKCVGYLSELAPLYQEMTIREFLRFSCRLKGVSKGDRMEQIGSVAQIVQISDVLDRPIANLSKGYRQRVGLAQALIGEPKVLILDEPTVGLDPNQIIQMRELIRQLGSTITVIISSHILSEVQTVCDRVIIMQKGSIIADGKTSELTKMLSGCTQLTMSALGTKERVEKLLSEIPDIVRYQSMETQMDGVSRYLIEPQTGRDIPVRVALFNSFAKADCPIIDLHMDEMSLEEVFHELTQSSQEEEVDGSEK